MVLVPSRGARRRIIVGPDYNSRVVTSRLTPTGGGRHGLVVEDGALVDQCSLCTCLVTLRVFAPVGGGADGRILGGSQGPVTNMFMEAQLKRPPQFQEIFVQTHKKKGTNEYYISEKAQEVAESYSRGMDERYGDDS
ncbi:hypothetical protein Taro_034350 [Colocasia esculenta]|uniref:Uncharacterized protein n=1 Tax=Colocasia esculenta TaxID=4460 RepID=A0A843W0K6_COLES|nr:hypothetical protein [Colocasia esculenta]